MNKCRWASGLARTGFDAEGRVARILEKDGPAGVLDTISLVGSDYVKSRYFRLLFDQAILDRSSAERAFRQSGREIGSDYERGRVLSAMLRDGSLKRP